MYGCISHAPYRGPGLQPRYVPLTGNQTSDPFFHRPVLNSLSHTSQGKTGEFLCSYFNIEDGRKYTTFLAYYALLFQER